MYHLSSTCQFAMAITRVHSAFFVLSILGLDLTQSGKHLLVETKDEDDKDYESDIEDEQCNKVVHIFMKI